MTVTPEQQAEIDALRAEAVPTLRTVSTGMESVLHTAFPVLDHGFVRVVDYMGDDAENALREAVKGRKGFVLEL